MVATSSCTISSTILSETGSSIPGRILHQNLKPAFRCLPSRRPDDFRTLLSFSFLSLSYCPKTRACHPERIARQAPDRLVCAILARGPAQLALDALVLIDVGEQVVVEIEVFPLRDAWERSAADVRERAVAALVQPVRQPVDQVLHDPETVVHHGGAHLQRASAQGDELGRVSPRRNAANPGDGNLHAGGGGDRRAAMQ